MNAIQERSTWYCVLSILVPTMALLLAPYVAAEEAHDEAGKGAQVACPIDRGLVTTNVLLRVFPLRIGSQVGTGFTMEIDNRQYLVTAKHFLEEELPSSIDVQFDEWITVPVELVGMGRGKQDVMVFGRRS